MAESLWILPFGKYKGHGIEDVPKNYLEWLLEQDWFLSNYSKTTIDNIKKEIKYRETFEEEDKTIDKNWNRR